MEGMRWVRALLIGSLAISLGLLWAWLDRPTPPEIPEEALALARPVLDPPYVVLLTDPLCPFCQRLEEALERDEDPAFRARVRILPYVGHAGSLEAWRRRAGEFGMTEEEMVEYIGRVKALLPPRVLTPTAVSVGENGSRKVVLGFRDYRSWKGQVIAVWKAN